MRNIVILGGVDYSGISGSELTRVIINRPMLGLQESEDDWDYRGEDQ